MDGKDGNIDGEGMIWRRGCMEDGEEDAFDGVDQ